MSANESIACYLDTKTRRKLQDQRRMRFRRAIEHHDDHRRLEAEIIDYPELALSGFLPRSPAGNAQPAC